MNTFTQTDLAACWGDAGRGLQLSLTHPQELVVRMQLPGVASAAAVELDVGSRQISAVVPGK